MTRTEIFAPNAFDALIGDIYECVIDATRWPATLAKVCEAIGGNAGWVAVHAPNRVSSTYQIETGTDPDWQQRLRDDYVGSSPFIGMAHYVRQGEVLSVGDVVDYDEFTAGRFYREWASPQGWPDLIFAVLSREADRFSFLGVCLSARATPENKRIAGYFAPHLDRALRILDLLQARERALGDATSALDAMSTGVVLVDARMGVRGINRAAEYLLSGGHDGEWPADGSRTLAGLRARDLAPAVAACASGSAEQTGVSLSVEGAGGRMLAVHVVPVPRPTRAVADRAVAALFVTDPEAPTLAPAGSVVERYGLTPSELRVALALFEGKTPGAIAASQGVSLATVRTHLRRLYEKTDTSGQAALVRTVGAAMRSV
ncbi:helix-turn-helix transcriptional regulator [Sphingomonas sp. SUN039]|uniref:helix-turn-helix transcriptional regulator n=1 Tax=Sphingomonas sp. SUN039 TaxID=2937787 RepID=UPI002164C9D5|nr:helix-turn-helix transcriptional regulator [Sphingomonas sp. SUN039]UVO55430.1 helix-turn-helix transcriptional regulator [Sphingomonas sp. SUN039]